MFKVNNKNYRTASLKLTIKIPERLHWRRSGVFIVNFEQVNVSWVSTRFRTRGTRLSTCSTRLLARSTRLYTSLNSQYTYFGIALGSQRCGNHALRICLHLHWYRDLLAVSVLGNFWRNDTHDHLPE